MRHGGRGAGANPRDLPRARGQGGDQGQEHGRRGAAPERLPGAPRHPAGGDRPRRIHRATGRRSAEPHHRARDPQDQGTDLRALRASSRERPAERARGAHRRGARGAAPALPRRRPRHHRGQLPGGGDRLLGHRHQRGQRRSDPDPAPHPCRRRLDREGGADAGGRDDPPPPAGPLRHRPSVLRLHDVFHRTQAA